MSSARERTPPCPAARPLRNPPLPLSMPARQSERVGKVLRIGPRDDLRYLPNVSCATSDVIGRLRSTRSSKDVKYFILQSRRAQVARECLGASQVAAATTRTSAIRPSAGAQALPCMRPVASLPCPKGRAAYPGKPPGAAPAHSLNLDLPCPSFGVTAPVARERGSTPVATSTAPMGL
jgi:hypothetical protein